MKNEEKIAAIAEEAARILKDYPHLKYSEAVRRAKEVIKEDLKARQPNRSQENY